MSPVNLSMKTETFVIKYDFDEEFVWNDLNAIFNVSGVRPQYVFVTPYNPTDNVQITFNSREEAIKFTEVYLDSEDPADIQEYVIPQS